MGRPTFTAAEIGRYCFCSLAWSLDKTGVRVSLEELEERKRELERKRLLSVMEEKELVHIRHVESGYEKRAAGEVHHHRVFRRSAGMTQRAVLLFFVSFIFTLTVVYLLWLIFH